MIQNFQNLPLSLNELIARMEACKDSADLAALTGLKSEKDEKISLVKFLQGIAFPVESYPDLTAESFGKFVGKMQQLFPLPHEQESKIFALFRQKIERKIEAASRGAVSAPSLYPGSFFEGTERKSVYLSFDDFFKQAVEEMNLPVEERLNQALQLADVSSLSKKAHTLQILLSILLMEQQLMKYIKRYCTAAFEEQAIAQKLREGCAYVLRLDRNFESVLFEFPSSLDEPDVFACWLTLCPYLAIKEHDSKSYLCVVPVEKWRVNDASIEAYFKLLKTRTTNSHVLSLINKIFLVHERIVVQKKLLSEIIERTKFLSKIERVLIRREVFSRDFENKVSPIGYLSFGILSRHILHVTVNQLQDLPVEDLNQLAALTGLLETCQSRQEALYRIAYQQLKTIVGRAKDKRSMLQFTKNLFVTPDDFLIPFEDSIKSEPPPSVSSKASQATKIKPPSQKKIIKRPPAVKKQISEQQEDTVVVKEPENSNPATSSSTSDWPSFSEPEPIAEISPEEEPLPVAPAVPAAIPIIDVSSSAQLPGKTFPYAFAERVERWHQYSFGAALPAAEFPEYSDFAPQFQERMHVYHVLHPLVDRFLSLGVEGKWINRRGQQEDLRIAIVAEVTFKGVKKRGVIVYTINIETQVCYHKFFTEKIDREIMREVITRTFDENDFPELKKAILSDQLRVAAPVQTLRGTVKVDPVFHYVDIADSLQDIHIRLFNAHRD